MLSTEKTYTYTTFGLIAESVLPLPELENLTDIEKEADIKIKKKDLSNVWSKINPLIRTSFVVEGNRVMFEVPGLAVFSIEDGKTITFSTYDSDNEDKIRLYILGSCLGILLMQRKVLPLHGSAIAIEGKAYAFIGESGAGKSTLASSFVNKGYKLLSDDVVAISLMEGNQPWVFPSYPQQKLWQESLNAFGLNSADYEPLFDRTTKFSIPVQADFYNKPLPLGGIFELTGADIVSIDLQPIEKLHRFQVMHLHTYRRSLIERMHMMDWHFKICAMCMNSVPIYRLSRPTSTFTAHEIVTTVLSVIKGGENK
ncbi:MULTISPECIES: aldolase [Peribacillus]|uniref:aldolase n=1 Tax=Peribacillus TaxID=2675229 RepID=UPI001F4E89A8|nr:MULTISPECIES: aldolase [unclassified Peribacillus]MCK1982996.1 aldolase [Peribacillus sp. Aquil_B1]MCK2011179.1 aldolase [Peribacillus sp. Aquil_B8]